MKNRMIAVLLCLCLLVSILPMTVLAAQTYSITYDANGGSFEKGTSQTFGGLVGAVQKIEKLTPTLRNYTFLGWSTDPKAAAASYSSDGSNGLRSQINLTQSSTTLYAVWEPKVERVRIKTDEDTLKVGKTLTLDATVTTKNGTEGDAVIIWASSDTNVAVVGKYSGEVLALDTGDVTVTARTTNSEKFDTCELNVRSSKVDVEVIASSNRKKGIKLAIGEDDTVPDEDLDWTSADPDVLLVKGDTITALAAGKSALYAFDDDGDVILYWVEVYATVTLDYNGGKLKRNTELEVQTEEGYLDLTDYQPEKSGYVLIGWAESVSSDTVEYAGRTAFSADTTIYALWQREPPEKWYSKYEVDTDWYTDSEDDEAFYISEPEELAGLAWLVNKDDIDFADSTVYLLKDIRLMGSENAGLWTPIGTEKTAFCGTLEGNGYTIQGLYVQEDSTYTGLFGYLGEDAVVRNLGIDGTVNNTTEETKTTSEGKTEKVYSYSGSLAGYAEEATVENCWSTAVFSSNTYAGGLIGYGDDVCLANCWFAGSLKDADSAGALFGVADDCTVDCCYYSTASGAERFAWMDYASKSPAETNMGKNKISMQSVNFSELLNDWIDEQIEEENAEQGDYVYWDDPLTDHYPDFVAMVQWNGRADTDWYTKDGVTFTITTAEELAGLAQLVNDGISFKGQEILLGADLYLGRQHNWIPIGTTDHPFAGIFDGRGHVIEAVYSKNDEDALGLFGIMDGAMVCNLGLQDSSFEQTGDEAAATFAASAVNSGIVNCWSDSSASSKRGICGGIVATADSSNILNCWFAGTVSSRDLVGAIVGQCSDETTVSDCFYTDIDDPCGEASPDSSVSSKKMTAKELKEKAFADTLNAWVQAQNSEQYFSWKAQTDSFPAFGEQIIPVTAVALDRASLRMELGQSVTLTASVLPDNTTYETVSWTSSNPGVASVDNGVVKAIANGYAEITAAAGNKTAVCKVKVGADDVDTADNACYAREFVGSDSFVTLSEQREITASDALDLCDSLDFSAVCDFSFADTDLLTREMACELICKQVLGKSSLESAETGFQDVPASRWSSGYIAQLVKLGAAGEAEDNRFLPDILITGTEFCELLLGGIGTLAQDDNLPEAVDKSLEGIEYHIYLDNTCVNPQSVLNGTYCIGGPLVRGLAVAGIDIEAELLENVISTTYLDAYTGNETGTIELSASNVLKQYSGTSAVAAYVFAGVEDGAITQLDCQAETLKAGDTAAIVLYSSSGKYSSASVTLEKSKEVSFTVKVFGKFVIIPKDLFKASDWDTMQSFKKTVTYKGFSDVNENLWYGSNGQGVVKSAVELGIMNGYVDGTFQPTGNIKLSEVIKMAAVVNNIYQGGSYTFDTTKGSKWYDTYVDYCISQGMFKSGDFADCESYATRAQMAFIFAKCLPAFELINEVTYDNIPDVDASTQYAEQILKLFGAGVLTGDAGTYAFRPTEYITRAEAAAIITRVALTTERVQLTF